MFVDMGRAYINYRNQGGSPLHGYSLDTILNIRRVLGEA